MAKKWTLQNAVKKFTPHQKVSLKRNKGNLNKHGVNKSQVLMLKNSRKVKAFNAEWLEYIEGVEDVEGNAMRLQYIYEVLRIEVLNKNSIDLFINAHYPSDIDSFNQFENEKAYHNKLLEYVVGNAQKEHEKRLEFESKKLTMDEDTKEVLAMLNMTEDEFVARNKEMEMRRELTPYEALLKSDKYVDCIRESHILLHGMSVIDSREIKNIQKLNDEQKREQLACLGLSNISNVEPRKSVKNETSFNNMEQQEELIKREQIKKHQVNKAIKEIVLEKNIEKRVVNVVKSNVQASNHYDESLAAMEEIRNRIREYEEKYGDKAMEHMRLDTAIRELTRKVKVEEVIDEFNYQWQREKEQERKEWEKLFEEGQPVKWERTSNNPLEIFNRIRYGRIDKEDS
ncbi:hypothetical protein [Niallia nealsonii]|uniref:hypothetical protein n=1 Tax=Niallia nealsonii TaxID=115979 RepID=UPI0012FF197F|nr:hypothetical protein [Niallia nealsonii]